MGGSVVPYGALRSIMSLNNPQNSGMKFGGNMKLKC
jgi:hypothetical protein